LLGGQSVEPVGRRLEGDHTVSAMPAWSPDLVSARYDDGHGPSVGSWFTGHNKDDSHEWETRMRVTEAEPAATFAWTVIVDGAEITR